MKDGETLSSHKLADGYTVHLVIKSSARGPQEPPSAESVGFATPQQHQQPQANSLGQGISQIPNSNLSSQILIPNFVCIFAGNVLNAFGLPSLSDLGLGGASMAEMHQRFQQELMNNPEAMRQVLDSPFVQQVMNSPDIIRTMLSSNPQIQQLMEVRALLCHTIPSVSQFI